MVVSVPVHGVRTPYAQIGDVFAWLCLAGLAGFAVVAVRRGR
jgi:apolipoprotein N-acyltransferase